MRSIKSILFLSVLLVGGCFVAVSNQRKDYPSNTDSTVRKHSNVERLKSEMKTSTAKAATNGLDLAFAYSISDDTASAVAVGLNSGLNYESNPGQGWNLLTGAGLKIISDYGDQLTRCYLYGLSGSNSVQCQLGAMTDAAVMTKWRAYLQSSVVQNNLNNIVGFALSDDWYSNPGSGKKLFQDMTAAVHTYAPGKRSICIFTANTSYAHSAQSYSNFAAATNFSPSGCDMVGLYLYPTVNNQPLTNFTNAIEGLKINGLNPSVTPIIGIAESYNTTGAAVEKEVKYMCDNGATSIGFWAYNTGLGTAAAQSADIRGGMSRGIQYCGGAVGGGGGNSTDSSGDEDTSSGGSGGTGGYSTTTTDSNGNKTVTTTDSKGNATSVTTDPSGQIISTGTGTTTTDANGNKVTTITESNGNTTTTTTDANGNATSVTTDINGTEVYTGSGTTIETSGNGTGGAAGDGSYIGDIGSSTTIDNTTSGEELLEYWDPFEAITAANNNTSINAASSPTAQALQAIFGALGDSPATARDACSSIPGSAGLIPCGQNINDPDTAWNECDECGLCSMVLMGQITISFFIKIAAFAATLAICFAGYVYIFALGKPDLVKLAKEMIKFSLIGLCIIFLAWTIVDGVLSTLGYIDPLGGSWFTTCE